jgi:hypothetical protein
MYAQHHRHAIWNIQQHPYRHSLAEFSFINSALPGVTNAEGAINFMIAVLYPNAKAAVATPADLPTGLNTPNPGDVTPTINDYRVVVDDGDGNFASYRWEQREGDVSPQWYKVMDMDWSSDSILAQLVDITLPLYVSKNGRTDIDVNGDPIVGLYAGQIVYGGDTANQNLTLNANSGDGVGAQTGYVQIDSQFRPTVHNTYDTGSNTERWRTGYFETSVVSGTLTMASGSITDTSGAISFGDENLTTTGNITGAIVTGTSLVADDTTDQLTIVPGLITDTTGQISFDNENLLTTGTLGSGVITSTEGGQTLVFDPNVGGTQATITASLGTISFDDENLITTGTLTAGVTTVDQLNVDNLRLDNNRVSITNLNGNLELLANGIGVVDVQSALTTLNQTVTGTVAITGQLDADNIRIDGNTVSSIDASGNIILSPNGTGLVSTTAVFAPSVDNTIDLGTTALKFRTGYLATSLNNGINDFLMTELMGLRSANYRDAGRTLAVQPGDALFWSGSQWLASAPDTEIDHGTLTGLADDDHVQYALLAGRAGGQTLIGGSGSSDNLVLGSNVSVLQATVATNTPADAIADTINATNRLSGESFTPSQSGDLSLVTMYFNKNNLPTGNLVYDIYDDNAGDPGSILGTSSPIDISTFVSQPATATAQSAAIAGVSVVSGTKYWIVANPAGATLLNGTNTIGLGRKDGYDGTNSRQILSNDGITWFPGGGDYAFEIEISGVGLKGTVQTQDNFEPVDDAVYAAGWTGTDLGGASNRWNDVFTSGEFKGFRLENLTSGTLPASSAQNTGHVVWATDVNKAYVDNGSSFQVLGVSKYLADTAWNGTDTTKDINVSANIQDAREAIWALHDNANDFEKMFVNIKTISATTVRITVSPALPAGSYRLIGLE